MNTIISKNGILNNMFETIIESAIEHNYISKEDAINVTKIVGTSNSFEFYNNDNIIKVIYC